MAFFPGRYSKMISHLANNADRIIRSELSEGIIISERDYVSHLTCEIRRNWKVLPGVNVSYYESHTQVLPGSIERQTGADAVIIFINKLTNKYKVCLFEAKWPRLMQSNYPWDDLSRRGIPHFTEQLNRQYKYQDVAALWELFIVEHPSCSQPNNFDDFGATCLWHDHVYQYSQNRNNSSIWSSSEIIELVNSVPSGFCERNSGKNLYNMILKVCLCREGQLLNFVDLQTITDQYPHASHLLVFELIRDYSESLQ